MDSSPRYTVDTFDPRTVYPNPSNIALVRERIEVVGEQLNRERAKLRSDPEDFKTREARRETLSYLSLLNDWITQVERPVAVAATTPTNPIPNVVQGVIFDRAVEEDVQVLAHPSRPVEVRRCVVDLARGLHYVLIKKLRQTIYGSVKVYQIGKVERGVVRFQEPAEQVAIKLFDKERVRTRTSVEGHRVQEDTLKELAIQQRLSNPGHRYVMPVLACLESEDKFFAVLPFVSGGELFEYVNQQAPIPEPTARNLMRGMLDGVHYCHTVGVCHRDISLENFLLGGESASSPLLIDFGLAVIMEPGDKPPYLWKPIPHTGALGKLLYMAPEIHAGISAPAYDGCKVDVWSLGVCLAIMLTGVPLWETPNTTDQRFSACVINRRLGQVLNLWNFHLSPGALNLLERMLAYDPNDRPTIPEIATHEWIRG